MQTKQAISQALQVAIKEIGIEEAIQYTIDHPVQESHGDYSTNVAMILGKKLSRNPMELAEEIAKNFIFQISNFKSLDKVEVAKPGFINFWLSKGELLNNVILRQDAEGSEDSSSRQGRTQNDRLKGKKIFVEYAHPNTHKEMHIGHMRTLITGEALSRLFEASGATVFRANYQGDIGPHVAKALFGIEQLMRQRKLALEEVEKWSKKDKAHFLGEGYVRGNQEYEEHKEEIDGINTELYKRFAVISNEERDPLKHGGWEEISRSARNDKLSLYLLTRKWSLDYYDEFYTRFYTKFDRLFFESEMAEPGKKIVEEHIGPVFVRENGAVIFPGEKYGLHTRVFITQAGNPTYEGKEMGNAFAEYKTFPFDLKLHVVASEQAGYFQVVFKALELIDPQKFAGKQYHLSMGMVTLTDRKMSSRTGDILTVDWLIDQVRERVEVLAKQGRIASSPSPQSPEATAPSPLEGEGKEEEIDAIIEMITIGAIKYSVLKGGTGQNVAFDIEKSVSLDGNSGPYLQYSFARTQSVLRKASISNFKFQISNVQLEPEELQLSRKLYQFDDIVTEAAERYAPNLLCNYLFELAQAFNLFYQKHKILPDVISRSEATRNPMALKRITRSLAGVRDDSVSAFRLQLTSAVGQTLKKGLDLLGIKAPEKM